jgi:alkanesulfonate monooxygenase SsuD/methylene tetrahydromethanopterin reductase-like flavin-dependent oxidoreductase (luciferase family)
VQAFVGIITNQRGLTPRPQHGFEVPPSIAAHVQAMLQVSAVGTVDTVAARLALFYDRIQPDEIIIAKNFHDHDARLRSLALTIEAQDRLGTLTNAA